MCRCGLSCRSSSNSRATAVRTLSLANHLHATHSPLLCETVEDARLAALAWLPVPCALSVLVHAWRPKWYHPQRNQAVVSQPCLERSLESLDVIVRVPAGLSRDEAVAEVDRVYDHMARSARPSGALPPNQHTAPLRSCAPGSTHRPGRLAS